ncbi:MAG TPA: P-II family nitrogen regulator [Solimonas sp.]
MKLIKAFIHHVRTAAVVDALADAGYRNLTLQDVRGMLKPITEDEQDYSIDGGGLVISEARLSLVVDDHEVAAVAAIIGTHARIGMGQSGMIYVSPIEQIIPIGSDLPLSARDTPK